MRRKTLTTAVLAGLTGMAGMVSVSNAVNVNPDGLGQVLLYPYYSARGGNDTLISIVNTSDNAKSVKIRFIEALNSREVLDFNIYMSPFDVWAGAVTATDEGGAKLTVDNETCTVPFLEEDGEEFLPFAYVGDGGPEGIERTASGYVEVIEMGTLVGDSATAATHINGVPDNCQMLVNQWSVIDGQQGLWLQDSEADHEEPSGGLYGGGTIVNPEAGTMFSYNAVALDAFADSILHTDPAALTPDLGQGVTNSLVFIDGIVDEQDWDDGIFAVNATLTYNQLMNEYVTGGSANARSEWVLTFPTKRFHTDAAGGLVGADEPIPPFTDTWTIDSPTACQSVDFRIWDREEQTDDPTTDPIVSPPPPDPEVDFELCYESNVIRFGDANVPETTEILGEHTDLNVTNIANQELDFDNGWVRFDFSEFESIPSDDGVQYLGLPVIGFWVNTFTNQTLVDDSGNQVLSNYGGTFNHRGTRQIQQ